MVGKALSTLDNRWVSRAGNASFVVATVLAVIRFATGWSVGTLAILVLFAVGVSLIAAPFGARYLAKLRDVPFPRVRVVAKPLIAFDAAAINEGVLSGDRLVVFTIEVTNREPAARLNLVFSLAVERSVGGEKPLRMNLHRFRPNTPKGKSLMTIESPLHLEPESTKAGDIGFLDSTGMWIEYDDQFGFKAASDCRLVLGIEDYVSGKRIEVTAPGTFEL